MTNDLILFDHEQFGQVRVSRDENNDPWFVAADVARVLELTDIGRNIENLDDDEKGSHLVRTLGGPQTLNVVSLPGLLKLITRSRKPEAKEFTRWVFHEVLPAVILKGGYLTDSMKQRLEDEIERLRNDLHTLHLAEAKSKDEYSIREAALFITSLGCPMSETELTSLLFEKHWITPQYLIMSFPRKRRYMIEVSFFRLRITNLGLEYIIDSYIRPQLTELERSIIKWLSMQYVISEDNLIKYLEKDYTPEDIRKAIRNLEQATLIRFKANEIRSGYYLNQYNNRLALVK
jgi:prophage antirepressor-like protein